MNIKLMTLYYPRTTVDGEFTMVLIVQNHSFDVTIEQESIGKRFTSYLPSPPFDSISENTKTRNEMEEKRNPSELTNLERRR